MEVLQKPGVDLGCRPTGLRARGRPVRVLIVDDHLVLLDGLRLYLEQVPDIEIVGATVSGRQALDWAVGLNPDVVVLDLRLPDMDGLQVLATLRSLRPDLAVLVLTSAHDPALVTRAIRMGAAGFLTKEVQLRSIPAAILAIVEGGVVLEPSLVQEALRGPVARTDPRENGYQPELKDLTDQELRVLALIGRGMSNAEVAETLYISRNTVKSHLSSVYEKLGVSDRTQAAIWAVRAGLVD